MFLTNPVIGPICTKHPVIHYGSVNPSLIKFIPQLPYIDAVRSEFNFHIDPMVKKGHLKMTI